MRLRGLSGADRIYDHVIVGAGAAGCVLANRLSTDPDRRVLLLEAGGGDRSKEVAIPAAFPKLFRTVRDWGYSTEPAAAASDRRLYIPRGKMIGGSSSMNAMIYIRGRRQDYDGWAARGCEGWGYEDVLPFFRRSERNHRLSNRYHGTDGEMDVTDLRSPNPLSEAFVAACVEAGHRHNDDFNGETQDGAGLYQVTQRHGRRWSAASAFLRPVRRRPNLTVLTGARATEVVFDRGRACGVAYVAGGRRREARSEGDVILAAGALNTPQLLLLSGIGPPDHLREVGVVPRVALPVGDGLQDHPVVAVAYESNQPVSLADAESARYLAGYLAFRSGKLTSNIGEAGAFVRVARAPGPSDIQFHFGPAYFVEHGFRSHDGHAFTLGPTLITPQSRGSVRLGSLNPLDKVRIEAAALQAADDVAAMVAGVRLARAIAHRAAFDPFRGVEIHPGPDVVDDAALERYVRDMVELLYHPVGTCAMGAPGTAVVGPRLEVNGVDGLRIADASVMPHIVAGNTHAATVMIAERAAEWVLADG